MNKKAAALLSSAAGLLFLHGAVLASETTNYTYDPLGRLVGVSTLGGPRNGTAVTTDYDPAGNRENYSVADAPTVPGFSINDVSVDRRRLADLHGDEVGNGDRQPQRQLCDSQRHGRGRLRLYGGVGNADLCPGGHHKTITVATTNDTASESSETVLVNLSGATGGSTITVPQGTGTILDNDTPPSFAISDVSATEGGSLTFTVTKTGAATGSFSVNYATANGTATSPSDYTAASGTLTFAQADTARTINRRDGQRYGDREHRDRARQSVGGDRRIDHHRFPGQRYDPRQRRGQQPAGGSQRYGIDDLVRRPIVQRPRRRLRPGRESAARAGQRFGRRRPWNAIDRKQPGLVRAFRRHRNGQCQLHDAGFAQCHGIGDAHHHHRRRLVRAAAGTPGCSAIVRRQRGRLTMSNAIRRHVTRFALVLAAAGLAAGGGAQAQDVPEVVSPLRVESDPNGVNLVTGRMQVNGPVLSVPGAPNLRFDAVQNAAPYVRGTIQGQGGEYATASYSIHTGRGSSESFRCVDSDCTSITESGSNFTPGINNYREGNSGARYRFNLKHERTTTSNPNRMTYYASSVTFPNGEVISYTYETATLPDDSFLRTFYRPTRVSSNMGFSISIAYQGDVLGTAEWNSVSTAAIYNNSAPTTPLQRLTYASDGTITDLGGRTWTCSACANMLGIDLEVTSGTLQLPGETSTSLQVAPLSTAHPVVGSVTRDGVAWNYGYTNIRSFSGSFSGRWYDRITVTGPNGYNTRYDFRVSDRRNVLTRVTDSLDRVTTYDYDVSYRPIRIVYPEGNRIDIGYDGFGNIISRTVTAKPNSPLGAVTETLSYPTDDTTLCDGILNDVRCFRPRWSRDGLNRQTDYAYNDAGQLIEQIDPADANGVRRRTYIQYETTSGTSRRDFVEICAVTAGGPPAPCGAAAMIRTEYDYWNSTLLPTARAPDRCGERRYARDALHLRRRGPQTVGGRAAAGTDDASISATTFMAAAPGRSGRAARTGSGPRPGPIIATRTTR